MSEYLIFALWLKIPDLEDNINNEISYKFCESKSGKIRSKDNILVFSK